VSNRRILLGRFLQLGALSALAVGQPLLDLLKTFPGFLVAHRCAPLDIVLLALALLLVLPISLFALTQVIGIASRWAGLIVHRVFIALLASLIVAQLIGSVWGNVPALVVLVSVLMGGLFAYGIHRTYFLSAASVLCSAGIVVFFVLFIADSDIRSLIFHAEPMAVEAPRIREKAPVVVVIFDELPLTSLLDANGAIDEKMFPAFSRLAGDSTWFRNATSVASYTQQAIPAILTGRYPGTDPKLAIASEHPYNLFSLLAGSHELNVYESQMQIGDPEYLPRPSLFPRMRSVLGDLSVVYLHVILPASLTEKLPRVDQTWTGFSDLGLTIGVDGEEDDSKMEHGYGRHPGYFRHFVSSIENYPETSLHFIHSTLPHRPWRYTPTGRTYFSYGNYGMSGSFQTTSGEWWQQEAYQRHLLQLQFTDKLLGELLDRLVELGLYEPALIVLTADHGVGFWPDDNARFLGLTEHPEDILSVPLLVKKANQKESFVDNRNVETIDILPSIADLMGADFEESGDGAAGFEFDGCSLYDKTCLERAGKVAYWSVSAKPEWMEELHYDRMIGLSETSLRRKIAWFGAGLYRFGPYAELVGRHIDGLVEEGELAGKIISDKASKPTRYFHDEDPVPVRISGLLDLANDEGAMPHVAITISGVIQTVVPAPQDGTVGRRVLAMIPQDNLISGSSPVFFLVDGPADQPRLRPLDWH
jgi:hypothetical protein